MGRKEAPIFKYLIHFADGFESLSSHGCPGTAASERIQFFARGLQMPRSDVREMARVRIGTEPGNPSREDYIGKFLGLDDEFSAVRPRFARLPDVEQRNEIGGRLAGHKSESLPQRRRGRTPSGAHSVGP